ncbi:transcription factor E2F1-like [Monodelphis domestica]|uniref:transcription factor E2F1-like n=1 Tax=Monodelphis domestica TaxID=13616 RepID=UPI0024E1A17C|nr:transcription factor E2F1-like [Monodelphis domestica]
MRSGFLLRERGGKGACRREEERSGRCGEGESRTRGEQGRGGEEGRSRGEGAGGKRAGRSEQGEAGGNRGEAGGVQEGEKREGAGERREACRREGRRPRPAAWAAKGLVGSGRRARESPERRVGGAGSGLQLAGSSLPGAGRMSGTRARPRGGAPEAEPKNRAEAACHRPRGSPRVLDEESESDLLPEIKNNLEEHIPRKKVSKTRYNASLCYYTRKFMDLLKSSPDGVLHLKEVAAVLGVGKRRVYDITNVLHGIELIQKKSKNCIQWITL